VSAISRICPRGRSSHSRELAHGPRTRAWRAELEALRPVLLRAGLEEEFKWRKPCYTHGGSNVVIFQPFKELCALLFFKGALLKDPDGVLQEQGENTRSALRLEFRSVADVTAAKRTPPCATHGSASPPAAGAAGCCTSTAPSSLRPASRASSAPHRGSSKASGYTTRSHNQYLRRRRQSDA
jgi:hypothetical protein